MTKIDDERRRGRKKREEEEGGRRERKKGGEEGGRRGRKNESERTHLQRRPAVLLYKYMVSAVEDERLDDLGVTSLCSQVQGRVPFLRLATQDKCQIHMSYAGETQ